MKKKRAKTALMSPAMRKTFNKGKEAGVKEATDIFHSFLSERMQTLMTIPGIGEKTAWKVHEHFIEGTDER